MIQSFEGRKQELDEACEFMRSFTLGRQGFTQRDGVAAIGRVGELCERMQKDFGSGRKERILPSPSPRPGAGSGRRRPASTSCGSEAVRARTYYDSVRSEYNSSLPDDGKQAALALRGDPACLEGRRPRPFPGGDAWADSV